MTYRFTAWLIVTSLFISCRTQAPQGDDGKIELSFVQVNDVYEIAPLEGGKTGGLARLATLKKQTQQKTPNTFMVMAGDFLSPSVYGSLTYEGKRIRGRQMIDAMNAAGFDLVCFGNHEFDIPEKDLQDRIDESRFTWISANAFRKRDGVTVPFQHNPSGETFPKYVIKTVRDVDGTTARIGFISVVLGSNPAEYVIYTDPLSTAIETYQLIKDSCDAIVALTHMAVKEDMLLADAVPSLPLIMGGHEHGGIFEKENSTFITKAQSNAKTAYVTTLTIDKRKKKVRAEPRLVHVNESIGLDSLTNATVQKWVSIANNAYASSGFDAGAILPYSGEPLEGRDEFTRREATNLTRLIGDAMLFAAPAAEASVFNTGSIRVDDVLYPPITQYDILRTLPFGGGLREVELRGALLQQVLDAGYNNRGSGGWLQYGNIVRDPNSASWLVKGQPINPDGVYLIVVPEFLLTGKESNLGFFNEQNPGVIRAWPVRTNSPQSDIRLAIIRYLESKK